MSRAVQLPLLRKGAAYHHIFFVPGNGIPSFAYYPFLAELHQHYGCPVRSIEVFPHMMTASSDGKMLLRNNWSGMVQAVKKELFDMEGTRVLAIGHSLGAALLVAALEGALTKTQRGRPQHFVSLDPPLFSPRKRLALRASMQMNVGPLANVVASCWNRTRRWDSFESAKAHLESRSPYKLFTPRALKFFLEYGLKEVDGGVELVFPPEVESQIFRTTPLDLNSIMRPRTEDIGVYPSETWGAQVVDMFSNFMHYQRTAGVYGLWYYSVKHEVAGLRDVQWMHRHFQNMGLFPMEDHFAPLSHPEQLAQSIIERLAPPRIDG